MAKYRFTPRASKEFFKLDPVIQERIISKLDYYCSTEFPTWFARHLTDNTLGQYRFRVGDYRIICDIDEDGIRVVRIGHRRDIYK